MGKKIKVTFYMKSGNKITVRFKTFTIDKLSGNTNRSMNWTGNKNFTIDIDEIEAVIIN